MKLKCPGCAKLLQIPDTAAGKVVKCSCGKQLRVPAPKSAGPKPAAAKPAAAAGPTAATRPAAKPAASPARPAPAAPASADDDFFDDLTDTDLAPVKAVHQPGQKAAAPAAGGSSGMYFDGDDSGDANQAPRPIVMYFLAVYSFLTAIPWIFAMLMLLGAVGMIAAASSGESPESAKAQDSLAAVMAAGTIMAIPVGFKLIIELASGVCCFLRGKGPYATIVFTYSFGVGFMLTAIVGAIREGNYSGLLLTIPSLLLTVGGLVFMYLPAPRTYFGGDSITLKHPIIHTVIGLIGWFGLFAAFAVFLASRMP